MTITDTTTQTIDDAYATLGVLREKGWDQGAWCKAGDDGHYGFCLGGAMAEAISQGAEQSPHYLAVEDRGRFTALAQAMNLPTSAVDRDPIDYVVAYNDEVAEVIDDVKVMLRNAIVRLSNPHTR